MHFFLEEEEGKKKGCVVLILIVNYGLCFENQPRCPFRVVIRDVAPIWWPSFSFHFISFLCFSFFLQKVLAVAWSPINENLLASAGRDSRVIIWDVRMAGYLHVLDQHNGDQAGASSSIVSSHSGEVNG